MLFLLQQKYKKHYISFYHGDRLNYPELISDGRKKFKILLINENEDLPAEFYFETFKSNKTIY